jgi:hypothetical protein
MRCVSMIGDRSFSCSAYNLSNPSLAVIDAGVQNCQTLAAGVFAGTEVLILDSTQNGIEQISEILSRRSGISSLHIISQCDRGSLQLGSAHLNATNLEVYGWQLQQWADSFNAEAQILFHGCNLGTSRQNFVQQLGLLTGLRVAVRRNITQPFSLFCSATRSY